MTYFCPTLLTFCTHMTSRRLEHQQSLQCTLHKTKFSWQILIFQKNSNIMQILLQEWTIPYIIICWRHSGKENPHEKDSWMEIFLSPSPYSSSRNFTLTMISYIIVCRAEKWKIDKSVQELGQRRMKRESNVCMVMCVYFKIMCMCVCENAATYISLENF